LTTALADDDAQAHKLQEDRAQIMILRREVKGLQQELICDRDKLRISEESNRRWQETLASKQAEIDSELKDRVERIVEKERHDYHI